MVDYDWNMAETHFRKAMAAEAVPPGVRVLYVWHYLFPWGRFAEGIEQCRLSLETDPVSVSAHLMMVNSLRRAKQYPESMEYARRGLEIDANHHYLWSALGLTQLQAGLAQEAIASFKRAVELTPWNSGNGWALAAAYHQAGDRERSRELARKLAGSDSRAPLIETECYYAATGEVDAMFEALDAAYRQRSPGLPSFHNEPFFDPYRADPRFQALLQRMNLA
jgi:serine/threonine-protein kinase